MASEYDKLPRETRDILGNFVHWMDEQPVNWLATCQRMTRSPEGMQTLRAFFSLAIRDAGVDEGNPDAFTVGARILAGDADDALRRVLADYSSGASGYVWWEILRNGRRLLTSIDTFETPDKALGQANQEMQSRSWAIEDGYYAVLHVVPF